MQSSGLRQRLLEIHFGFPLLEVLFDLSFALQNLALIDIVEIEGRLQLERCSLR